MTEILPNFIRKFTCSDIPTEIRSPVEFYAATAPDSPAVLSADLKITYSDLYRLILSNISRLNKVKTAPVTLLAISDNVPELLVLIWSCFHANITICPINPKFPPEKINEIAVKIAASHIWINLSDERTELIRKELRSVPEIMFNPLDCADDSTKTPGKSIRLNTAGPANLILTSGSSGTPKAACHCIANHLANADDGYSLKSTDRYLQSLPLFHIGGLAISFRCFTAGAAVVFPSSSREIEDTVKNFKITHLSLVPTQLFRMLKNGFDFSSTSVTRVMLGGGVITKDLLRSCLNNGICPFVSYGLTEMSSQVCTRQIRNEDDIENLHAGPALKNREIKIENNEILVRGKTLFLGYYDRGTLTAKVDSEGFFHTGDCGYLSSGNLYVTGRKDNQFISGGENIQPENIEKVICEITGSPRAVVTGIKDPEWGEIAVAVVEGSTEGLKEKLKKLLPPHEVPKIYIPWPYSSEQTLKIQRKTVCEYASAFIERKKNDR
jgi:O-succinylbenzoic acid--CoA ligase